MGIGVVQVAVTLLIILLLVKPVGKYIVNVFDGQRTGLDRIFGGPERLLYRVMGVRENESMGWKKYLMAVLLSNFVMLVLMFLVLRLQKYLPLNPDGIGNMPAAQAFNTAVSFMTNTNWQSYSGRERLVVSVTNAGRDVSDVYVGSNRICSGYCVHSRADRPPG